jgi:phage tail sheath protein FI
VPGAVASAQHSSIYTHCFNLKDRFAILDGVEKPSSTTDPTKIEPYGASEAGSYGAVYFPWIQIYDPVSKANAFVPPSGHLAGIYARTDSTRGVHKAPANEVVLGALGLEYLLGKSDQNLLNPAGVNVIRSFNGTITVWGARTRADASHSDFKYISTRRLFIFISKSIEVGTQWVVFEPNTPALWQSIIRNVSAFLTNLWRSGALFGDTAAQAFYVRCDEDLNPPEVRDLGQVIIEVGVAIVRPAEFVIFRIGQWTGPSQ